LNYSFYYFLAWTFKILRGLIKAIDYARSLLLKTDTIYEHEKQMKDFDIQMLIYFSEMRYNNKQTPYDFNCYNEHEYKKIINHIVVK
jgi:hypothetical protein